MEKLAGLQVYEYQEGRVLDDDELPAPDAISDGYVALTQNPDAPSNAINEFNAQFERLRSRLGLLPVVDLLTKFEDGSLLVDMAPQSAAGTCSTVSMELDAPSPAVELLSQSRENERLAEHSADEEEDAAFARDNDLFMESPTLQCIDESDVSLDMDKIEDLRLGGDDELDDDANVEERW